MIAPDRTSWSPFFNNAPPSNVGVVIHATRSTIAGNPSELEGTLNWFKNPAAQVSAHWVIGRRGEKVRVIPDGLQSWHAGRHNATHYGIELAQATEGEGFTVEQIAALVAVCVGYVTDHGIPVAHAFNGFVGHQETPQGKEAGKSDPGRLFPWGDFIQRLVIAGAPDVDPTLAYIEGRHGWYPAGRYMILFIEGVPTERHGGDMPGWKAKNYGGNWIYERNDGRGGVFLSEEPGD